jgi:serine/threonine protein kinase
MITGKYPFDGNSRAEVFSKIQKGSFTFPESTYSKVTPECIELIRKLLTVDRNKRLSGDQALHHDWFDKCLVRNEGKSNLLDMEVMKKLREFKGSSTLKKAALNVLVKMLNPREIEGLR